MKIENQSRPSISQAAGLTCYAFLVSGFHQALTITWQTFSSFLIDSLAHSTRLHPLGAMDSLTIFSLCCRLHSGHLREATNVKVAHSNLKYLLLNSLL